MSRKFLSSWKSPFVVGGVIGTILLLIGMNLMVGAHVSSKDETQTSSPTQTEKPSGESKPKSRYIRVDGPVLIGLGAVCFIAGTLCGCIKYFNMQKEEKKKIREQNANEDAETGVTEINDDVSEIDGADNDAYSMTPKSRLSLENTPPPTPLADMVHVKKHPLQKQNEVIITSDMDPVTIINNRSPGGNRLLSSSPSSPMPLLNPLETHFVFQALANPNPDKSSSASSSPVSVKGNKRQSWYISESPDSHLVRADYNALRGDSSPNISSYRRTPSSRTSKASSDDLQRDRDSVKPKLLHPNLAYQYESSKSENSNPPIVADRREESHGVPSSKDTSERSSPYNSSHTTETSNTTSEDTGVLQQRNSDDSGYSSSKRQTYKSGSEQSDDTVGFPITSDDLPRRSLTKSRNVSSSSSASQSSERGGKGKRVIIAVSSGEDTVFEDVIAISRPQNPEPPKSPRMRTCSTGPKYSSPQLSHKRVRQLSYPGPHRESPEEYYLQDDQSSRSSREDRSSNTPPSKKDFSYTRGYRDSKRASKRTASVYGSSEQSYEPQKLSKRSHQPILEMVHAEVHHNSAMPRKSAESPHEYEVNSDSSHNSRRQGRPYGSNSVEYQSRRDIEGAESPRMRHHSETAERPKTWANGLYQREEGSPGNKRLSDLPEVTFPHDQSGSRKRRKLPDIELVKRRQSRGSSSSTASPTPSPSVDLEMEDTDDEWI